jgi:putative transposase
MQTVATVIPGSHYNVYGKIYEVITVEVDRLTLRSVTQKHILFFAPDLFNSLLIKGELRLHAMALTDASYETYLLTLPQDQKKKVLRKIYYVRRLAERFQGSLPRSAVETELERLAEEFGDEHAPGYTTAYLWFRVFRESNFNPYSLVKRKSTRPRGKQLGRETHEIISQFVHKYYLQPKHPTIKTLHTLIEGHIENENDARSSYSTEKIKIPSLPTVSRDTKRISQYYKDARQLGHKLAEKTNNYSVKQVISRFLLRLVEGDSHEMDIIVVDEIGRVLGRPWLHILVETSTRYIIGYELSLTPPCAEKFLKSLRMALLANDQYHGGRMGEISVDNGAEANNDTVKNVGYLLNVKIDYGPPATPNARAIVERFFGTLNSQLTHSMEGSTDSNPIIGKYYKAEDGACVQMIELNELFDLFVHGVYHHEYHSALYTSPNEAWLTALREQLPPERYTQDSLNGLCRQVLSKRINNGRVQHKYLSWTGPALPDIAARLGPKKKAKVYLDITDLSTVWIAHPDKPTELYKAYATAPHYQNKLTMYAHELVLKELKEKKKRFDGSFARQTLLIIYNKIWEIKHNSTPQSRHNRRKNKALLVAAEQLGLPPEYASLEHDTPLSLPETPPSDTVLEELQSFPTYIQPR